MRQPGVPTQAVWQGIGAVTDDDRNSNEAEGFGLL